MEVYLTSGGADLNAARLAPPAATERVENCLKQAIAICRQPVPPVWNSRVPLELFAGL